MNRFAPAMTSRSDAELVAIVKGRSEDWEPDAITAAREELAKRNVTEERCTELGEDVEHETQRARRILDRQSKALAFVAGVTIVLGVGVLYFYNRFSKGGEKRKAWELVTWFCCGVGVHLFVAYVTKCH